MKMNSKSAPSQNAGEKKKWVNPFRFTSLFKPMVYMAIFCIAYAFGYLSFINISAGMSQIAALLCGALILSVFGVALYFVCTLVWGKKRATLGAKKIAHVWIVCLVLALFTSFGIGPLAYAGGNTLMLIAGAVLGLVMLLFALPTLILFFYAVYSGHESWNDQILAVMDYWKSNPMRIINYWLVIFLIMYLWDNMLAGPLYSAGAFDAPALFSNLMYLSQPGTFTILLLMNGTAQVTELVMLTTMGAIILVFLSCNTISWIGHVCKAAELTTLEAAKETKAEKTDKIRKKNQK